MKDFSLAIIGAVVLAELIMPKAWGFDQDVKLSQYTHTAWRSGDAFDGTPIAIAQTKDGYLWIGTKTDLLRFDGVRFTRWSLPSPDLRIGTAGVTALTATGDGSLWIAGYTLMRLKDGKVTSYNTQIKGLILSVLEDPSRGVWIARILAKDGSGPVCHILDQQIKYFGKEDGMPIEDASALFRDNQGMLWLGGAQSIVRGRPRAWKQFPLPSSRSLDAFTNVAGFESEADGSILVRCNKSGKVWGLQNYLKGTWAPFKRRGLDRISSFRRHAGLPMS